MKFHLSHIFHAAFWIFFATELFSQQPLFRVNYQEPNMGSDKPVHISTTDGGMMLTAQVSVSATSSLVFIKTDTIGNIQWQKSYDDLYYRPSVVQSTDNGYFGCYRVNGSLVREYRFFKIDSSGNPIFHNEIIFPMYSYDVGSDPVCMAMNDGTVMVAATLFDNQTMDFIWHFFKVDTNGALSWSHFYNVNQEKVFLTDYDTCANGDIVLCGDWEYNTFGEVMVTRFTQAGAVVWSQVTTGSVQPGFACTSITVTSNDEIALLGTCSDNSQPPVQAGPAEIRLDGNGNVLWAAFFPSPLQLSTLHSKKTNNGGVFLVGQSNNDAFGMEIDNNGLTSGMYIYANVLYPTLNEHSGGGFVIAGKPLPVWQQVTVFTVNTGGQDCWGEIDALSAIAFSASSIPEGNDTMVTFSVQSLPLVPSNVAVTMSNICLVLGTPDEVITHSELFPNPADQEVQFSSSAPMLKIEIYDIHGSIVSTTEPENYSCRVYIGNLASGTYFVRIRTENHVESHRLIIE